MRRPWLLTLFGTSGNNRLVYQHACSDSKSRDLDQVGVWHPSCGAWPRPQLAPRPTVVARSIISASARRPHERQVLCRG